MVIIELSTDFVHVYHIVFIAYIVYHILGTKKDNSLDFIATIILPIIALTRGMLVYPENLFKKE